MFRRASRLVIAFAALLSLQIAGVGHAMACEMGGHVAESAGEFAPAAGMRGMAGMSGMATPPTPGAPRADGRSTLDEPAGERPRDHGAPTRECMATPVCAAVLTAQPHGEREHSISHDGRNGVIAMAVIAPLSVTFPPDLRPPRA